MSENINQGRLNDYGLVVNLSGSDAVVNFSSPPVISNSRAFDKTLNLGRTLEGITTLTVDGSGVIEYDTFLIVIINSLKRQCNEKGIKFSIKGFSSDAERFVQALGKTRGENTDGRDLGVFTRFFVNIGDSAVTFFKDTISLIEFIGEFAGKFALLFFKPKIVRWRDLPYHFMRSGVNGVFIVLLILFLIGLITGYQGALQLRQFGADIYIANLVGISIVRELSPLMTAILVAGRSGSAFAAEIGTMKVSEEVDALRSLGFDITGFLVLPRVLAVMAAMPILTLMADASGIFGGLVASISTLDISVSGFINQLGRALSFEDIFSGLVKSVIFGTLIAIMGCFRGLQVKGGAESVGKYTTASVVSGVLMIIISDAIFTFVLDALGI